jgi:3-hexulose-6-phosphate synthase/6-phospho-3-hexuloisomerase
MIEIKPPITQIALDYTTIEEAIEIAHIAVEAGFDWLEIGTPLITVQGIAPIGQLVEAFPDQVVLADYKTMDSGFKNVQRTRDQGGHLMTVCGGASDATVKSAIDEGKKLGIGVVVDTIGSVDHAARARQCYDWGVDVIYIHYSADERREDDTMDAIQWLQPVLDAVPGPVGLSCFSAENGATAARMGAEYFVTGYPPLQGDDSLAVLTEFVQAVKENYTPR